LLTCAALLPFHSSAVSVDVTRAFDNVDIPLLLSIVEPLLRNESYIVLKYQEVRLFCITDLT